MNDGDLAFTSAIDQARLVRTREVSPVELVECYLRRIEALNPLLNAYLTVAGEQALEAARRAAEAPRRRPAFLPRRAHLDQGPHRHRPASAPPGALAWTPSEFPRPTPRSSGE